MYWHTLSTKLPEGSSHRVNLHRNALTSQFGLTHESAKKMWPQTKAWFQAKRCWYIILGTCNKCGPWSVLFFYHIEYFKCSRATGHRALKSVVCVLGFAWRTAHQMTWSVRWALTPWSTSCCLSPSASLPTRTSSDWWPTRRTESCTPEPPS